MTSQAVLAVCALLGLVSHSLVSAQWMGLGGQMQAGLGAWGGNSAWGGDMFGQRQQQQQDDSRFLTCIAANSHNDDMRITFSTGSSPNNQWGRFGMMGNGFANAGRLRLEARIASGTGSNLQGQYQLVVTTYSRSEEVCLSRALGDILSDQTPAWWGRREQRARGIVGQPMRIIQGQITTSSEIVENIRYDELPGRGMALCPVHQISGTTCVDAIPLCCKIGYDTQRATIPFTPIGQMFQQPGALGNQNGGFGNSMVGGSFDMGNTGFANTGFGQQSGLNQGFDPGMNQPQGLVQGGQRMGIDQGGFGGVQGGFNNAGPQNQAPLAF